MNRTTLLSELDKVESIAKASRIGRLLTRPFRYVFAILYREWVYKKNKQAKEVVCQTFFGQEMHILLPSSTDIYLTGGKSHESEIRLARLLIQVLKEGDVFVDAGAHYGYFSLLAAGLVGSRGKVLAFEAAPATFEILQKNSAALGNITAHHLALSDRESELVFYEFPNQYAEYNALDIAQFEKEGWIGENPPREYRVQAVSLEGFLAKENLRPTLIKIDVEGAEYQVIQGMQTFLMSANPIIVMEYLSGARSSEVYARSEALLVSLGYLPFAIEADGTLLPIKSAEQWMSEMKIASDNIVFRKEVDNAS
jgi:FkbM family methyltransferase